MKRNCSQPRGFTLIELMIVVAILAILASVAIVLYQRYVEKAKSSEAVSILGDIRLKQEAYRATFHQYASIGNNVWYPDANPGASTRIWDTNGALGTPAGNWRQLGITPDRQVYYSYLCEAGSPGMSPNWDEGFGSLGIEDQGDFWFAAAALQDFNEDTMYAGFVTYSGAARMIEITEEDGLTP